MYNRKILLTTKLKLFSTFQGRLTSLPLLSSCGRTTAYHQMLSYFLMKFISKNVKNILEESHSALMKLATCTRA